MATGLWQNISITRYQANVSAPGESSFRRQVLKSLDGVRKGNRKFIYLAFAPSDNTPDVFHVPSRWYLDCPISFTASELKKSSIECISRYKSDVRWFQRNKLIFLAREIVGYIFSIHSQRRIYKESIARTWFVNASQLPFPAAHVPHWELLFVSLLQAQSLHQAMYATLNYLMYWSCHLARKVYWRLISQKLCILHHLEQNFIRSIRAAPKQKLFPRELSSFDTFSICDPSKPEFHVQFDMPSMTHMPCIPTTLNDVMSCMKWVKGLLKNFMNSKNVIGLLLQDLAKEGGKLDKPLSLKWTKSHNTSTPFKFYSYQTSRSFQNCRTLWRYAHDQEH